MRARVPGIVLALIGLGVAAEATTFDVGFLTDPVGPKALPLLAGAAMALAGARAALRPEAAAWPPLPVRLRVAGAVASFLAYALLLAPLGFFASTTLAVGSLGRLYGARPLPAIAAGAALSAALWLLFVPLLALPLPVGALWTR